jgi:ubiquinone/menaquinone biosynthesis C-methylase UbiE
VNFRHGNASDMPFGNNLFNFIVCQAAFKNFSEPVQALNEMHRVLKPGAQAVILDLRADASEVDIAREVAGMHLNWFNAAMTRFVFKYSLLKRAYTAADFRSMAAASTFKTCTIEPDGIGLAVWFTKSA